MLLDGGLLQALVHCGALSSFLKDQITLIGLLLHIPCWDYGRRCSMAAILTVHLPLSR